MTNQEVADILLRVAEFLEVQKENPYRVKAYRKAAETVSKTPEPIENIARDHGLEDLRGIGKDLARKIEEILETGTVRLEQETEKEVPKGLAQLLKVHGLPGETARFLYHRLKIQTLEDLERLAKSHLLRTLPGFTEGKEKRILEGIERMKQKNSAGID